MNELLKINYDAEQPTVSARDLHEGLEIGTQYTKWFERMCEYGFAENADYRAISQKRLTAQGNETTYTDHEISIDMAKQICMIQRSEKGKLYRQYFIDLEKAWNTPEQVMARALKLADRTIDTLKEDNKKLIEENERMKPKEIFADAVSASTSSILIGDLAKLLRQNGVDTGQKRLFEQLRNEGYLMKTGSSRNMPKQRYVADGLFQIKETVISNPDGSVRMTKTTKVTGKGQQYFLNKYLRTEEVV
jgi:anti-repressor protein|nr:MAG TPA: KilAC domain protein [Caudoviricetes sp.]